MWGVCSHCAKAGNGFKDNKCDWCHKKFFVSARTKEDFAMKLAERFGNIINGLTWLEMDGTKTILRHIIWTRKERRIRIRKDGLGYDWLDDGDFELVKEMLRKSLTHLNKEERKELVRSFEVEQ
jgi:hypothetical protein